MVVNIFQIQGRIKIWDEYREDQTALLDWLKEMESERNKLKLRYITLATLKKTMYQIEVRNHVSVCLKVMFISLRF